jgi:hypothetical protein
MRVQFTATFDELVDATLRAIRRVRQESKRGGLVGLVVTTAGTGTLLGLMEPNPEYRWIAGSIAGAIAGVVYALLVLRPIDGRVRAAVKQQVGSEAPFEVVVKLTPDGLSLHQMNTHLVHEWGIVEEIEEDQGDIVFHVKHGNILVVRARAFESADARRRFVEMANHLRGSRNNPITQ